jgi:antitoxin component YwqK of YwqJK toxin-antitoxin module
MINYNDLAQILFPYIDDSRVWCNLSQLNKRFNKKSKEMLFTIKKYTRTGYIKIYSKLPNGVKHGKYQWLTEWPAGQRGECYLLNGKLHGPLKTYYANGQLEFECTYLNGNQCSNLREY